VILDSSAVVAIALDEPDAPRLRDALMRAVPLGIGAATLVECGIVLAARAPAQGSAFLATLLDEFSVEVLPFDAEHARVANDAWRRFGRGRHAANLNFGDCLAYATARLAGRPLLCAGEDFAKTDLPLA
jgi:ribonuclease VapC